MNSKEREQRSNVFLPSVELRAAEEEGKMKKIIGYAVKWDSRSNPIWGLFQEQFRKGAFQKSLSNQEVVATWQHRMEEVLGRTPGTLTVAEDEVGLRYEIDPPSWAERHIETIERGDVRGSSFIFRAIKEEWDESDPDMALRTVTEASLFEVCPVTIPAYPQSVASARSAEDVFESRASVSESAVELELMKLELDLLEMEGK